MNFVLWMAKTLMPPERADKSRRRIACIGDSITFGAGVLQTRKTAAWTAVWEKSLGEGFQVLNYGVSGATLLREGDFPYRKEGYLRRLKTAKPELIVLMLGTNDSKPHNWDEGRFAREYEELVTELKDKPWPHKLVLMTPPKAFPEEQTGVVVFEIRDDPIRDKIRPLVFALGEKYGVQVIDLYALTEDHSEYFGDGVHPNELGNRVIAEHLQEEIAI